MRPPSYECVRQIIKNLDPALVTLAHQGTAAYREEFELAFRLYLMGKRNSFMDFIIVLVLMGMTLFLLGGIWAVSMHRFLQSATSAGGKVIRVVEVRVDETTTTHKHSFIQFTASDGTLQEFEVRAEKLATGDHVLVMYDPKYPSRAFVPSFFSLGFWPLLVFCLGGLALATAAGVWIFGN